MGDVILTAWDAANKVYRRLVCDEDGKLTIDPLTEHAVNLKAYDGAAWQNLLVDADKNLKVSDRFGGNVYSKTMTMTDNNATRFEATAKLLRDVVIVVKTNDMLLGETGVEVYPVGAGETVGFTKVDISTLYFKNAGADDNGVISILGVEE